MPRPRSASAEIRTSGREERAVLIERAAALVEHGYATIQLSRQQRESIAQAMQEALASDLEQSQAERASRAARRTQLQHEQRKLLEARYAGAVPPRPAEVGAAAHHRELEVAERRLAETELHHETVLTNLERALELLADPQQAYLAMNDQQWRLSNQSTSASPTKASTPPTIHCLGMQCPDHGDGQSGNRDSSTTRLVTATLHPPAAYAFSARAFWTYSRRHQKLSRSLVGPSTMPAPAPPSAPGWAGGTRNRRGRSFLHPPSRRSCCAGCPGRREQPRPPVECTGRRHQEEQAADHGGRGGDRPPVRVPNGSTLHATERPAPVR